MKHSREYFIIILLILFLPLSTSAHDPKEHAKKIPEKANCAVMEKMKADKENNGLIMNMTDPVVMAMMKRCSKDKEHGHESSHPEGEKNSHSDTHETNDHEDNNSDGEHKH